MQKNVSDKETFRDAPEIDRLFEYVRLHQGDLVCTAGIDNTTQVVGEVLQENGLYGGHEYSLLRVKSVTDKNGSVHNLVQIRYYKYLCNMFVFYI